MHKLTFNKILIEWRSFNMRISIFLPPYKFVKILINAYSSSHVDFRITPYVGFHAQLAM